MKRNAVVLSVFLLSLSIGNGCSNESATARTCIDECSEDVCSDSNSYQVCEDSDDDGCTELSEAVSCRNGESCKNGACKKSDSPCSNECTENQCSGETAYQKCEDSDGDGCKELAAAVECNAGETCSDGVCQSSGPACPNECLVNRCSSETAYQKCEDADGDGCKELSEPINCDAGDTCSDGFCQKNTPQCKNECTENAACDGNSYQSCADIDDDGCMELTPVSCNAAESCTGSACICKYGSTDVENFDNIHLLSDEGAGKSESKTAKGLLSNDKNTTYHDEYLYSADGQVKIGGRQEWGGSIIYFGQSSTDSQNTIDLRDSGRNVQAAVYDLSRLYQHCAHDASCWIDGKGYNTDAICGYANAYLGWNPVQGGNECNNASGILSYSNKNGLLEFKTNPLFWNPDWDATDCTNNACSDSSRNMRRSDVEITVNARFINTLVAELYYSIRNKGTQDHTNNVQELPVIYAGYGSNGVLNYRNFRTANDKPIEIQSNGTFLTDEPWVALMNDEKTYGVGILYENGTNDWSGHMNNGDGYNRICSRLQFGLPKNGHVQARAYLLLGNYATIADQADKLQKRLPPFGVLDNPAKGASVSESASVSGWALDNRGVTKVIARVDETTETALTYGTERADVCATWVGYPNCSKVGFSGTVSFAGLTKDCPHLLEIIATDTDGNNRTIARRIINLKD